MASRTRIALILVAVAAIGVTGPLTAQNPTPPGARPARPDFDIRIGRATAVPTARASEEMRRVRPGARVGRARVHPHTGAMRVLTAPGWWSARRGAAPAIANTLAKAAARLGLENADLGSLSVVRDYASATTGLRHIIFSQSLDGIPVFGGAVSVHIAETGEIVRITSGAATGAGRRRNVIVPAEQATMIAAEDINPDEPFAGVRVDDSTGARQATRFARGSFLRDVSTSLAWFAMDGGVRLAWHVQIEPEGLPQFYDLLIDAETGELLFRRNRVHDGDGTGRVVQSNATQALDPRQPDQMPVGDAGCPPPTNLELRDLTLPFRDPATVLGDTGRLSGNNTHVFRGNSATEGAVGTFDGSRWLFDFPFNSAGSAETALFFALNFAHDFFYNLGFDEASGNFQVDNFGRGGLGNDAIRAVARAAGRNNATFLPADEGSSPTISMFLWDGTGCWAQDVDGDGSLDLDGDYDTDIILHEFHHGVSHRLNTVFDGNEAGAIGEGGSDFFAYSVDGDTTLAEYSRAGGLRAVNGKTYADWTCLLGLFCEPHQNGEIWANVLWDVRQRFRADLVRDSEAAATNESHQLYVDGLRLSPPSPTMLDLRDAMLQADTLRNPGSPRSVNFCRLWESFAGRGMGLNATDTADNGFNQVGADFSVPEGCEPPPPPPTMTVTVNGATATEAGPTAGGFTISRSGPQQSAVTVSFSLTGTAVHGTDYTTVQTLATIPSGAASVDVPIVPIDDPAVEANETVVLTLRSGVGYIVGSPASATVTIVSEDVAPDFVVTAFTVPQNAGAGQSIEVTDTTRNQGSGASGLSTTSFYLSTNALLDAGDPLIGSREVPGLAVGASDTATTTVTIPAVGAGIYTVFARADAPAQVTEPNEGNNNRIASIRIGPDLVVASMTAPASAGPGSTISVTDTTKNQGGSGAGASSTRFYLSPNYLLDPGDVPLQTRSVGPLAVNATHTAVTSVTIPVDTGSGTFYLIAKADDEDAVDESSDTNNAKWVQLRIGADLQVFSMTAPSRVGTGTTISVTDTTRNIGGGDADESTTAFYLSSNITFDTGDLRLNGTRTVPPLNANQSSSGTTAVMLPAVAPGTWYLMARADDGNVVVETLESNNVRYVTVFIGPDLTISSMSVPSTIVAGSTVTVSDTVRNLGAETAPPSTTRFYLSLNPALDASDTLLEASRAVPALAMNATSAGSTSVVIPAGVSGSYYLLAVADGNVTIAESSETNNVMTRLVTINP